MKFRIFLVSLLSFLCITPLPAFSFQLDPLSQTFSPKGAKATRSYKVTNGNDKPIAVEISVMKREVNAQGEETLLPANDDFIIYPLQMILEPQAIQTVKVTWVGDSELTSELAYRLVAEQLPINLQPNQKNSQTSSRATASVNLMMRYAGSLYIQPANAQADVVLANVAMERDETGEKWLSVHLKNQGTARRIFEDPRLMVSVGGQSVILQNQDLGAIHSHTILAGAERRFRVPWPSELPEGEVTGQLILD